MLSTTNYTVPAELMQPVLDHIANDGMKHTINKPTGNFFYDSWEILPEYKDTVWAKILETLPDPKGEARVIILAPGCCYQSHADIDDRYHLNISGESSYLVDLETDTIHRSAADSTWYCMDAGRIHSAANFGRGPRAQLVVRKLLNTNQLASPVPVSIQSTLSTDDARQLFDLHVSSWLNRAAKLGIISQFAANGTTVSFSIEQDSMPVLESIIPCGLELIV